MVQLSARPVMTAASTHLLLRTWGNRTQGFARILSMQQMLPTYCLTWSMYSVLLVYRHHNTSFPERVVLLIIKAVVATNLQNFKLEKTPFSFWHAPETMCTVLGGCFCYHRSTLACSKIKRQIIKSSNRLATSCHVIVGELWICTRDCTAISLQYLRTPVTTKSQWLCESSHADVLNEDESKHVCAL